MVITSHATRKSTAWRATTSRAIEASRRLKNSANAATGRRPRCGRM